MRRSAEAAFSLIEVAIAIAVMAILAGAAVPLVMKALNQQKEQRARAEIKLLYESLFGSKDRTAPNMHSDFGYSGPGNLAWATRQPAVATVRAYAPYAAPNSALSGGWRGPYYNGNTDANGNPVDPWGNVYVLRNVNTTNPASWQILCTGENGANDTAITNGTAQGDDIVYPIPAQMLRTGTINVNAYKTGGGTLLVIPTATVISPGYTAATTTNLTRQGVSFLFSSNNVPSGVCVVHVLGGNPLVDQYQAVDLPSMGTVTLNIYFIEP